MCAQSHNDILLFQGKSRTRLDLSSPLPSNTSNWTNNGPSWSVRLLAAPLSLGPRFPGLTANPTSTLVPPGVCGSWPLLVAWDPQLHFRTRKHASWPGSRSQSQGLCHALNPGSGQPTLAPSRMRRSVSQADAKQLSCEQYRAPNPVAQEHESSSHKTYLAHATPATRPNTTQSKSEIPSIRLPCKFPATSPAAYRPGTGFESEFKTAEFSPISKPHMQ